MFEFDKRKMTQGINLCSFTLKFMQLLRCDRKLQWKSYNSQLTSFTGISFKMNNNYLGTPRKKLTKYFYVNDFHFPPSVSISFEKYTYHQLSYLNVAEGKT